MRLERCSRPHSERLAPNAPARAIAKNNVTTRHPAQGVGVGICNLAPIFVIVPGYSFRQMVRAPRPGDRQPSAVPRPVQCALKFGLPDRRKTLEAQNGFSRLQLRASILQTDIRQNTKKRGWTQWSARATLAFPSTATSTLAVGYDRFTSTPVVRFSTWLTGQIDLSAGPFAIGCGALTRSQPCALETLDPNKPNWRADTSQHRGFFEQHPIRQRRFRFGVFRYCF
jgi:hypothetical protein